VVATGRDIGLLNSLKAESGCIAIPCDLRDPDRVLAFYNEAREVLGDVDLLVNNAGFNSRKAAIMETGMEEFEDQYAVNLRAPYILCREALQDMSVRRSGHMVNVLSSVCRATIPTMGVYSAMKYGLMGLTQVLIKEAREYNVKVTGIYPGGTNTEFRANERPEYMKPESVAEMVLSAIFAPDDVVVHELTVRPIIESNF
jgi:short-subunit dehydrogenase